MSMFSDQEQRAETLSGFLGTTSEAADALACAMRQREYRPKSYLHHQGDADHRLWLILEGTIQLEAISTDGQSTVISAFGPGQLVGAVSDRESVAYDARALDRVRALEIGALELRQLLRDWPDLGAGLSTIYSGQLEAVLDRLAVRVTLSAVGRFYRELLRTAGSSNTITPMPVIAALALSAQTTRETGSRATNALERRGIIARGPDSLTIVSRRMLEELVV